MSTVAVKVKWVKEKYDVEIMLDEPVEVFKAQVLFPPCPLSHAPSTPWPCWHIFSACMNQGDLEGRNLQGLDPRRSQLFPPWSTLPSAIVPSRTHRPLGDMALQNISAV
jgi:hypothetical protein